MHQISWNGRSRQSKIAVVVAIDVTVGRRRRPHQFEIHRMLGVADNPVLTGGELHYVNVGRKL